MAGTVTFAPGSLRGSFAVPGDKSISHRALIVAALGREPVEIRNLNTGLDVAATAAALRILGASVETNGALATVCGAPLRSPGTTIEAMNSGSTARMLMGVCAGAGLRARFDGDASLRARPMEPVAAQLRAFGARIETTGGRLPATIERTADPQTRRFILLTPSAQIKSALLFAGLFARVAVTTLADTGSRDHTERLLRYLGAEISFDRATVDLRAGPSRCAPIDVVGDFSTAAFSIVAATVAERSSIVLKSVGVNQTRTGLLDALLAMGARIRLAREREICGEAIADIIVESAPLHGITLGPDVAARAIDELPVLAVAAAFARGDTRIAGVRDLRTKESDRLRGIERLLSAAGVPVETLPNGILIRGGQPRANGAVVQTMGDHRIAMAAAALAAGSGGLSIDDADCIGVSAPEFVRSWPLISA